MDFNSVLNGVVKYVDKEIVANLNPWQEVLARIAIARTINNADAIKDLICNNAFARTFAIADDGGNIDAEGLIRDLKNAMQQKGHIEVDIPMFGKFKFVESDVDKLYSYIRGI